jgi:HD-GYP domain-containing protein (c-di-GMP phosphodiesterase class II)
MLIVLQGASIMEINKVNSSESTASVVIPLWDAESKGYNLFCIQKNKDTHDELNSNCRMVSKLSANVVQAMQSIIEIRDPYIAGHQKRTASLCAEIGKEMKLSIETIKSIQISAHIHDIGKITIPCEVLNKPGKLNKNEYELIKTHSRVGYEIVRGIEFSWPISEIILQHHERIDGSGYPAGLKNKDIRLEARILAVADVIDAMTSDRPYRPALSLQEVIEEITRNSGVLYDNNVVEACLMIINQQRLRIQ